MGVYMINVDEFGNIINNYISETGTIHNGKVGETGSIGISFTNNAFVHLYENIQLLDMSKSIKRNVIKKITGIVRRINESTRVRRINESTRVKLSEE